MESRGPSVIVVDTNILAYYWLRSPSTAEIEDLAERDPGWLVPPLWRSEFRNVLAGALRHGVVKLSQAIEIMSRAEARLIPGERSVSSRMVMELVAHSHCTAYDCEFVAVARAEGLQLVTTDRQILREFPHLAVSPSAFLAA